MIEYRKEIDGLRAIAVIPVIFYHAGYQLFGGGFVGVDVFFVISGYLITTIILNDLESKKFSLLNFYERRARRILPALFLVVLCCVPAAWFMLLPDEMEEFSKSLIAVSTFTSNIHFWQDDGGYFAGPSELKPLIHTWSLAIEEQFYIILPIFLVLTWRLGRRFLLVSLLTSFVISLSLAHWGSQFRPSAAFYLLPTRAWELLIGSFVAFYLQRNEILFSNFASNALSTLGLAMILTSVFLFNSTTPFPGLAALAPTLGTALVILFANRRTLVFALLSHRAMVGIGLISYSLYLWHQPLLAFSRIFFIEGHNERLIPFLLAISVLLAWISWKYIEMPFRKESVISSRGIYIGATFISSALICFGIVGYQTEGKINVRMELGFKHQVQRLN